MLITDAELGSKHLDDTELRFLELELRTGGSINVRQMIRAVRELGELRGSGRVAELETELADMEDVADEYRRRVEALEDRVAELKSWLRDLGAE